MGELLQLAEKRRVELNSLFKKIVPNVYFQPPENIKMKYPCIRYEFSNLDILHADNEKWLSTGVNYKVILITASPNPKAFDDIMLFKNCSFDRAIFSNGLYNYHFNLYF